MASIALKQNKLNQNGNGALANLFFYIFDESASLICLIINCKDGHILVKFPQMLSLIAGAT